MRYKNLANTDVEVSELAAGTWGMGGRGWGGSDKDKSIAALRTMVDLGVNPIDTAPVYGRGSAEEVVGEAIQGIRDKVLISTKCGIKIDAPPGTPNRIATTPEIIACLEG
jgi:aryl-alcohol dehydrogenase-like predicted oxidoreductase